MVYSTGPITGQHQQNVCCVKHFESNNGSTWGGGDKEHDFTEINYVKNYKLLDKVEIGFFCWILKRVAFINMKRVDCMV